MRGHILMLAATLIVLFAPAARAWDFWQTPTDGDIWDMAPIGDLSGDGTPDLIAGAADNLVRAISSGDGSVLWSYPVGGDVWCVAAFPDLPDDADTMEEIVAGTAGNELLVLASDGTVIWHYTDGVTGDVWCLSPVGDMTGDGTPELAFGAGDNQVRLLDLKAKTRLWSRDLGGDIWSVTGGEDLNGDGVPDVVVGTAGDGALSNGQVATLDGENGSVLSTFDTNGDVWRVVLIDDIDGDGISDIVLGTAFDKVMCIPGDPDAGGGGGPGGGRRIWQSTAGSDMHVVTLAADYSEPPDGIREVAAGGLDDYMRLLDGKTGVEVWRVLGGGAIKDAILAPDIDEDGRRDIIFCTEGSTVNAVSAADGSSLWTYHAETTATFWSLAELPDVDGDLRYDLAAGSALNIVFGLPAVPVFPPDSVSDLVCVPAQTAEPPAVFLTWINSESAEEIHIAEVIGDQTQELAVIPIIPGQIEGSSLLPLEGAEDPRDFLVWPVNANGIGESELCTATMAPPPVVSVTCTVGDQGVAAAAWELPDMTADPGDRVLDGVRVLLDGEQFALLPGDATSVTLGELVPGPHSVVVRTVWGPYDSPEYTCVLSAFVLDLTCVAAQTPTGPGVLFTWTDAPGADTVHFAEVVGETVTDLADVPATDLEFLMSFSGESDTRDPRVYQATAMAPGVEGEPVQCTVTLAPPPLATLTCELNAEDLAVAMWTLPDPGLRELDGVRLLLEETEIALVPLDTTEYVVGELEAGIHHIVARTVWGPWDSPSYTCTLTVEVGLPFIRGDANTDGGVDISDAITILSHLFLGRVITCQTALEANGDGQVNIADAIYLLVFLFRSGPEPPPPYPTCGVVEGADCEIGPPCVP